MLANIIVDKKIDKHFIFKQSRCIESNINQLILLFAIYLLVGTIDKYQLFFLKLHFSLYKEDLFLLKSK